jgi:hypothetical protein
MGPVADTRGWSRSPQVGPLLFWGPPAPRSWPPAPFYAATTLASKGLGLGSLEIDGQPVLGWRLDR